MTKRGHLEARSARINVCNIFNDVLPATPMPVGFLLDTLLFAALVGLFAQFPRLRRAYRRMRGRCASCGYDLRATPIARPGPECGDLRAVASL